MGGVKYHRMPSMICLEKEGTGKESVFERILDIFRGW